MAEIIFACVFIIIFDIIYNVFAAIRTRKEIIANRKRFKAEADALKTDYGFDLTTSMHSKHFVIQEQIRQVRKERLRKL